MTMWFVLGVIAGAALGALVVLVLARGRATAQRAAAELEHAREKAGVEHELADVRGALARERGVAEERQAAWEESRKQLAGEFAELSAQALARNNAQFIELADARFRATQKEVSGDLEQRKQAIEQLLSPLREQLGKYEEGLRRLELERKGAYSTLTEQVRHLSESQQQLQTETRNLVTALRAPATRGRWGEMQLRRVVEMAGMVEHCDFDEQVTATTDDGRLRPDMVVHLPGARCVVVDAKVPLQAFLDANEASDDESRRAHLQAHARQLRAHVDSLAKKAYWEQFEHSPQFVVAFVPGEPLLAAALEHDPSLLEHAVTNNVVFATPTNLIALLRTVAAGWQQEDVAENAREVQHIGRELYKRLCTFGDHLARVGRGLTNAVESYNDAVGSLERRVLTQARRFNDLGVVGSGAQDMDELGAVDAVVRTPQAPESSEPGARALELVVDDPGRPALPGAADG